MERAKKEARPHRTKRKCQGVPFNLIDVVDITHQEAISVKHQATIGQAFPQTSMEEPATQSRIVQKDAQQDGKVDRAERAPERHMFFAEAIW